MLRYITNIYNYVIDYFQVFYNNDNIDIIETNNIEVKKNKQCLDNNIKFDSYVDELKYVLNERNKRK